MAASSNQDEMHKPLRIFVILGVVALALGLMALLAHTSSSRKALQNYKAELRAKGEKLSYTELQPFAQVNISDSLIAFTNAMERISYCRLTPGNLEFRKFIGPGQALALWKQDTPFGIGSGKGGFAADWEEFTAEIEKYRAPLEEVRDALKDPRLVCSTRTGVWERPLPNFITIRKCAQWLAGATVSDLHEGNTDQALQDIEAMAAVARINRDDCTLVSQMIRIAVANLGVAATWEVLQSTNWTEPQLARLQKAWESVELEKALERGIVGERAGGDEIWRVVRHESRGKIRNLLNFGGSTNTTFRDLAQDYVLLPLYRLTSMDEDELFRLKVMQSYIDTARAVRAHHPWSDAKQYQDRGTAELNRVASAPFASRYWLSMISIPNFTRANQSGVRGATECQMTIAAVALQRFKLRHGEFPESLETLQPEFLSTVPYDCFSGKALCYKRKPDGGYLLYSVGEDGKDDGGDASAVGKFGIWEGKDAVWPGTPEIQTNLTAK